MRWEQTAFRSNPVEERLLSPQSYTSSKKLYLITVDHMLWERGDRLPTKGSFNPPKFRAQEIKTSLVLVEGLHEFSLNVTSILGFKLLIWGFDWSCNKQFEWVKDLFSAEIIFNLKTGSTCSCKISEKHIIKIQ